MRLGAYVVSTDHDDATHQQAPLEDRTNRCRRGPFNRHTGSWPPGAKTSSGMRHGLTTSFPYGTHYPSQSSRKTGTIAHRYALKQTPWNTRPIARQPHVAGATKVHQRTRPTTRRVPTRRVAKEMAISFLFPNAKSTTICLLGRTRYLKAPTILCRLCAKNRTDGIFSPEGLEASSRSRKKCSTDAKNTKPRLPGVWIDLRIVTSKTRV